VKAIIVKGDVVYLIGGRLPGHRAPRGFVTCSRRPGRREVRARTSIPRILASGFKSNSNRVREVYKVTPSGLAVESIKRNRL